MDKEELFKPRQPTASGMREDWVDAPGLGKVRVRGLNRLEAMKVQAANGPEATERRILALGMVEPELTEFEAGRWQKAAEAGEIEPVSRRIAELSGMAPDAPKDQVKEFEANPDAEFLVLPGAEVGDDGSGPTGADV